MHKAYKAGSSNRFSKWEIELAQGKAKGLVGKYGFTAADLPDIEQELLLEIHLKRNVASKWSKRTATDRTILSRILDNRIRQIIETASAKKRCATITDSLETPVGLNHEGEEVTFGDILGDDRIVRRSRVPSAIHPQDLRIDLSLKTGKFSSLQLRLNVLFMEGRSIAEAAQILGLPRTTLQHEVARMRELFRREGFDAYL
ncbi:MAG: hypothetical protein WC421_06555 [Elusimicrobiales bacterium]